MKAAVICMLLAVAVLARAQDLQYEQAAYTDAAAPALELQDADESSFAETSGFPSEFSDAAKNVGSAISNVKQLFDQRKSLGGNVSPSRNPAPAPKIVKKPVTKAIARKPAKPARRPSALAALKKRPIIVAKKPSKKPASQSGRNPAVRRLIKKAAAKRRRIPRAPAAASGPVDTLWHSERHIPKDSPNRDPEMAKLNLALEAVKEDILSTNKQINDERRWVIAVSKIISSYNTKMKRVEAHIIALRKEMKSLYRKKKQIENLKLQKALEAKLKEAKAELATLTNSLKHVAVKQGELNKSGRDLRATISGIQAQLAKLRGQKLKKKCGKGKRFSKKAKKCVSICKSSHIFSGKAKKCVSRCRPGALWNKKVRKCWRPASKKGKKSGKKGKHSHKHSHARK